LTLKPSFAFSWLAEKVLATIQFYRMDTSCFVGRPNAPFYVKVGQGAPSGAMSGEDCTAFSPQALAMREDNKKWKVAFENVPSGILNSDCLSVGKLKLCLHRWTAWPLLRHSVREHE
jgi:hypothetical protein